MIIGSLFSGIGGLELGLERALDARTVWQVEQKPECLTVLAQHWPEAKRYTDVRTVGALNLSRVDLICGGFPCQDVSSAGKRVGLAGARSGLWFEFRRIVEEMRPDWVVVENVASGARAWVDVVVEGLGQLGYACLPVPLSAADVGAPHERARIFIVAAHADAHRQPAESEHAEVAGASEALVTDAQQQQLRHEPRRGGGPDGAGARVAANDGEERDLATDALCAGRTGRQHSIQSGETQPVPAGSHWGSPVPELLRMVPRVPAGVDRTHARHRARQAAAGARKRIAALGNSVVPQCAEVVGHVIRELMR